MNTIQIPEPRLARFLFSDTRIAFLWLVVRLYVGYEWIEAGISKFQSSTWIGSEAGKALTGFVSGALQKTSGAHPDVQGWYAMFLNNVVLPNASFFSYVVTFGEIAIGIALILGAFVGIAAFFGAFMNLNFLLAGTISVNPILFFFELFLVLAWRVAGWYGIDKWLLPHLGTPWKPGTIFNKK